MYLEKLDEIALLNTGTKINILNTLPQTGFIYTKTRLACHLDGCLSTDVNMALYCASINYYHSIYFLSDTCEQCARSSQPLSAHPPLKTSPLTLVGID